MRPRAPRPAGRRSSLVLLAGAVALASTACDGGDTPPDRPTGSPATDTVVDAAGRAYVFAEPPSRVVSLVPAATRTVIALGALDRLVGRTQYDTLSLLADLPSVGGGLNPSMEVLLSLDPDLVIRFAGETDPTTPDRLDVQGIPHFAVAPETVADVREMIRELGVVLGRRTTADSLVTHIDRGLARIRARVSGRPPVAAAFLVGGDPPWVAGPDTFVHELIGVAGGRNAFADMDQRWAGVSPEALLAREVAVFLTVEGTTLEPRLTGSTPVRRLSPLVQLPGPSLDRAALEVARALRPELFR